MNKNVKTQNVVQELLKQPEKKKLLENIDTTGMSKAQKKKLKQKIKKQQAKEAEPNSIETARDFSTKK
jgi:hypothetical protein